MALRTFRDCDYSAFISYAHDDDRGWRDWVTCFNRELEMTLPTRLRGIKVPKTHLSGKNGPVVGDLDGELRQRIAGSFVMILVVHDNYADSGWCQRELELFKAEFGDQGFRERLYIVAMSKSAMELVASTDAWKRVSPSANLVWMPFYQGDDVDVPIDIYSDRGIVANAFWDPFLRLREDLVKKIKTDAAAKPGGAARGAEAAPNAGVPTDDGAVRIFIESNPNESIHWEALAAHVVATWDRVVASMAMPPPPLYLRPAGLPMDRIEDFPLEHADGVVLLWGQKTPDSLGAQIAKVERRLLQSDLPPVIVARLIPPQIDADQTISALGWPVVRFNAPAEADIAALPEDAPRFEVFLRKVMARKKQRAAAARDALLAVPT